MQHVKVKTKIMTMTMTMIMLYTHFLPSILCFYTIHKHIPKNIIIKIKIKMYYFYLECVYHIKMSTPKYIKLRYMFILGHMLFILILRIIFSGILNIDLLDNLFLISYVHELENDWFIYINHGNNPTEGSWITNPTGLGSSTNPTGGGPPLPPTGNDPAAIGSALEIGNERKRKYDEYSNESSSSNPNRFNKINEQSPPSDILEIRKERKVWQPLGYYYEYLTKDADVPSRVYPELYHRFPFYYNRDNIRIYVDEEVVYKYVCNEQDESKHYCEITRMRPPGYKLCIYDKYKVIQHLEYQRRTIIPDKDFLGENNLAYALYRTQRLPTSNPELYKMKINYLINH